MPFSLPRWLQAPVWYLRKKYLNGKNLYCAIYVTGFIVNGTNLTIQITATTPKIQMLHLHALLALKIFCHSLNLILINLLMDRINDIRCGSNENDNDRDVSVNINCNCYSIAKFLKLWVLNELSAQWKHICHVLRIKMF